MSAIPEPSEVGRLHGRVAILARHRSPTDGELEAARRLLHAALLRKTIETALRDGPELNRTQRAELARLLGGAR